MAAPSSVRFKWSMTINVCGQAHCGPVFGFLVFVLQIATEPLVLFHHSGFDNMYFTVMFHRIGRGHLCEPNIYTCICNLELH